MNLVVDLDAHHYKKNCKSQHLHTFNLLKNIKISSNTSILDIGCGHGYIIGELSQLAPLGRSVGIDPSQNMISLASEMFPKKKFNNLEFFLMKAEEMNFDAESFDLILCTNAFMWIRDPHKALKLISKFLKPNSLFTLFSYLKETPYVQLFEDVLERSFPELKKASAVNTMLSIDQHSKILIKNHMSINHFKVEEVIFKYKDEIDFKDYVMGWLSCYAPLNFYQQEIFLNNLIDESKKFKKEQCSSIIEIPHKSISIIASKQNSSL